ncbi:MAG: glutaredoxin 3 [Polyangiaceae bacterium]|nr:glutaredoxin 3 [Polyangiaceae bacterium]
MPDPVQIFTTAYCPYCVRAKSLLARRGIPFEEIDVTHEPDRRQWLVNATGGRRTVPQIFIGGESIGGSDELHELDRRGELLALVDRARRADAAGATG